uniref:Uncharacterized protein n=1 Tax=Anopheles minimus TaxID=112268 RepID=A0A182WPI3_9DIPT
MLSMVPPRHPLRNSHKPPILRNPPSPRWYQSVECFRGLLQHHPLHADLEKA